MENNMITTLDGFLKKTFTHTFLTDLLCTASYGSFWFSVSYRDHNPADMVEGARNLHDCREDIWAEILLRGGNICITDNEEEEDHILNLEDIKRGFALVMFNHPSMYKAIMDETFDLYDADAVIQCAVFGELTYG